MPKDLEPIDEMARALEAEKFSNGYTKKSYKDESDEHKSDMLSASIASSIKQLKKRDVYTRIDFNDLGQVKERTFEYLEACQAASAFPTMVGLASKGYGVSRQALYNYLNTHDNDTTRFVACVNDAMADIKVNAACYNNANSAMVIFTLINQNGWKDSVQIEPVQQQNLLGEPVNAATLAAKYASVPVDMPDGEYGACVPII